MDGTLRGLAALVRERQPAVVLTGAGISTESGIPDFRSAAGLWVQYDPMEFADTLRGVHSYRQPSLYFPRPGGTFAGESLPGAITWARAYLQGGQLCMDVGQGEVPWTVLADPEGNEFCVLGPLAAAQPVGVT